jgi:hypothetical protein
MPDSRIRQWLAVHFYELSFSGPLSMYALSFTPDIFIWREDFFVDAGHDNVAYVLCRILSRMFQPRTFAATYPVTSNLVQRIGYDVTEFMDYGTSKGIVSSFFPHSFC